MGQCLGAYNESVSCQEVSTNDPARDSWCLRHSASRIASSKLLLKRSPVPRDLEQHTYDSRRLFLDNDGSENSRTAVRKWLSSVRFQLLFCGGAVDPCLRLAHSLAVPGLPFSSHTTYRCHRPLRRKLICSQTATFNHDVTSSGRGG